MAFKSIPKGTEVIFKLNGERLVPDTPLLLEEDLTISLTSRFDTYMDSPVGADMAVLGSLFGAFSGFEFSGQFKQFGFQNWKGTDPASFSMNITLSMKTNATKDVLNPAKILMALPLPDDTSAVKDNDFGQLISPAPTILDALTDKTWKNSKRITCTIGVFNFGTVVLKAVEPTFSHYTDDHKVPIWCKLKIDVSTLFTATKQLVDGFGGSEG